MIRRILVALDGSRRAPGVFDGGRRDGGPVRRDAAALPGASTCPRVPAAAAGSRPDPLASRTLERARTSCRTIADRVRPASASTRPSCASVSHGASSSTMSDEMDADLIVVGSHGYHGLDRILGTTAARVANVSHRSVLVVHGRSDRAEDVEAAAAPYRQSSR